MAEQVTLVSPDGRRYTTDNAAEVTALVGAHGYQRASHDTTPGPRTAPEPEPDPMDLDPEPSYLDREDTEDE